jgi:integrase
MGRSRGIYNRTFDEAKWEQVLPENKAILDDFVAEYRQRKKAKGTIDGYFQDLRIILIYILEKHKNRYILEMTKKDFRNLSLWLSEELGLSSNRVNRMKSALNSMLTFCEEDDDYEYSGNIAKKVRGIPKERVKTNESDFFFNFDEFIKVRDILVERGDLQTAIIFSLGFDSGARRAEVYGVLKHNLANSNKTNIVRGKRGKMFPLIYLDDTRELIKKYLEKRGEDNIDSLWYKGSGDHKEEITYETMYDRILKCADILSEIRGEECNMFFHSLRHSRAFCLSEGLDTRILDSEGNPRKFTIEEIALILHHDSVDTTKQYLKDNTDEKIDNMFGFNKSDQNNVLLDENLNIT